MAADEGVSTLRTPPLDSAIYKVTATPITGGFENGILKQIAGSKRLVCVNKK